jgi:hypothetical protein
MDMSGAMLVVVAMMVVICGGMMVGMLWPMIRRRRNRSDHSRPSR